MEWTRICILNNQGKITKKISKRELLFLYVTYLQELSYIIVKYHDNIPKGIQVKLRENNTESMKARVAILVGDTSSRPVLHDCKVS